VSLIASAVSFTVALSQSIQTAHYVNHLAMNVSLTLISQKAIDKKIETQLDALVSVVVLLGDEIEAIKTHVSYNGFVSQLNLIMNLNGAGNILNSI
jgi:hypothetical protein